MHSQYWMSGACVGPCVKDDFDGTTKQFNEAVRASMHHSTTVWDVNEDTPLVGILSVDEGGGLKEVARFKIDSPDEIDKKRLPSLKDHWDNATEIKLEFGQMRDDVLIASGKPENKDKNHISGRLSVQYCKDKPSKLSVFGDFYRYGGKRLSVLDMEEKVLEFERGLEL